MALSGEKPSRLLEDLEPCDMRRRADHPHESEERTGGGRVAPEVCLEPLDVHLRVPLTVYEVGRPVNRRREVRAPAALGPRDEFSVLTQERDSPVLAPRFEGELLDPDEHGSGFRGADLSMVQR